MLRELLLIHLNSCGIQRSTQDNSWWSLNGEAHASGGPVMVQHKSQDENHSLLSLFFPSHQLMS